MFNTETILNRRVDSRSAANDAQRNGVGQPAVKPLVSAQPSPHRNVVQAQPLDIDDLNTDDMAKIEGYVIRQFSSGRLDLIKLLRERIQKKDPEKFGDFLQILDRQSGEFKPAPTEPVTKLIHLIWMGNAMKTAAFDNILDMYGKLVPGWKLILWTDSRKEGFLGSSPADQLVALAKQDANKFEIRKTDAIIDTRIQKTYALAIERNAYSMASDLARYSILHHVGGVYMDVDLNLGDVDLNKWNLETPDSGLPALGPNLRDKSDRDASLPIGLNILNHEGLLTATPEQRDNLKSIMDTSFRKIFGDAKAAQNEMKVSQPTLEQEKGMGDKERTNFAARIKYMQGLLSNQFIAVPPNHAFIDFLLEQIGSDLEARTNWQPAQVASLTGPSKFSTIISGFFQSKDKVKNLESLERRHLINPEWTSQISDIQWLTAESENQLGKKEEESKKEPDEDDEGGSYLLPLAFLAASAAVVGIYFYLNRDKKTF